MKPEDFQRLLSEQIILIDGAMGTMIQNFGFDALSYGGESFQMLSDILVLSNPAAIQSVHLKYFEAGANAVETNSFGASPLRLEEFDFSELNLERFPEQPDGVDLKKIGIEDLTLLMNRKAAQIAQSALSEYKKSPDYDGRPLFVLGSIGPSNWVLSSTHADLKKGDFEQILDNFYLQSLGLIQGGADVLLFETQQDILEVKAAVLGAKKAMKELNVQVAMIAQVTVDKFSKMQIFNTDILAALTTVQDMGIDAFGINCSIGPDLMLPTVQKLSRYSKIPLSIIPNAGLPVSEEGQTVFKLTPKEMGRHIASYISDYGVNIVGGCCGTSPDHIRELSKVVKGKKPVVRTPEKGVFVSGPQNAYSLDAEKGLIRIGERLNVRGSKKVRDAVERSEKIDQEALEEVLKEQVVDLGLNLVDVCMDSNQVDTAQTLVEVIKAQTVDFTGVMCIDSFDVEALEQGIKAYPGRPVINSFSLEEYSPGIDKIDAVASVTADHAPVYIALTADGEGPAVTSAKKIELARRIIEKARDQYGIKPDQIMVDINAFPIGSESEEGLNFALESIGSIEGIKAIAPGVKTVIGVGNLTNGLASKPYMRKVLTSVFLDEARKKGLDAAIVNPNHYVPVSSLPEDDYKTGKQVVLEHDMEAFAKLEEIAVAKKGGPEKKKTVYEDLEPIEAVCRKIKDGHKQRVEGSLEFEEAEYAYKDAIVPLVAGILSEGMHPLDLINDHLMKSMEELGAGFAEGEVSLPHLLKSADVMKHVMGFLEAVMKKKADEAGEEGRTKGVIVLGTVYQDVHSIGKDLAKTLLENYGYKVIDLGVQVPLQTFVDTVKEHKADYLGLSALLVQTSNHMITLSEMMKKEGLEQVPILVGGAPVNQRHAAYVAMAGESEENQMRENVFYCNSAMDGVNLLNSLSDKNKKEEILKANKTKLLTALQSGVKRKEKEAELLKTLPRRKVDFSHDLPALVDSVRIETKSFSMAEFLPNIDQKMLFSLNWRYGGKKSWEKKGIQESELQDELQRWVEQSDKEGWILPSVSYGLFLGKKLPEGVGVFHPEDKRLLGVFSFNEVIGEGKKDLFSVADYFSENEYSCLGVQLGTSGPKVGEAVERLKAAEDQEAAWAIQGLSDRVAEDLAEWANRELERIAWGKLDGPSTRYSPGYPAMQDLKNNGLIFDLLEADKNLGVKMTSGFEFVPTGTTAAFVCFHPKAGYK